MSVRIGPGRLELLGLELGDRVFDRSLELRIVESLALGRSEDEVQHAALLGGELGLDQIGGSLRVGARDLELVLQAAADGADEKYERGDDPYPRDHHAPRVRRTRPHPAGERPGRKSLVCGEPAEARFGTRHLLRHPLPPLLRSSYDG
jgi:hypothetical protein